ncbi:MAG: peptidyl-prolyl cis-trans isomerase [Asticcacaulis sp.]
MRAFRGTVGLKAFMVMTAMCLVLAACDKPEVAERPPEFGDTAVARIHDEIVWASDVRNEAVAQGLIGEGEPLDMASPLFRRTLEEVIDRKLLAREARKRGLDRSDQAQRRIKDAEEAILGRMLLEGSLDAAVDEKKVTQLYNEQLALAKNSEEVRARLILVKTRPEAENILKQIEGGSVFEALAMERSIDQATRFNGGDMGYFATDVIPDSYRKPLLSAKVGQAVGPVEIDGGWAVFKLEDRRPEVPLTLEEARPAILSALKLDQVRGLLVSLRDGTRWEMLIDGKRLGSGVEEEPANAPPVSESTSASESSESRASSASSSSVSAAVSR